RPAKASYLTRQTPTKRCCTGSARAPGIWAKTQSSACSKGAWDSDMPQIHTEAAFESEICTDLAAAGWLHDANDAGWDRDNAIHPGDLAAWIEASQPTVWEQLQKNYGSKTADELAARLRKTLDTHGTLHVLREGFEMVGLRAPIQMAQFRPALAMNADLQARYAANRLRVIQQVRYSLHNDNRIDVVLTLN